MTFPDCDRLREALAVFTARWRYDNLDSIDDSRQLQIVVEAARLVASETTLIVEKVNGEWPLEVRDKLDKWGAVWVDAYTASELLDALLAQQTGDTE